MPRESMFFANEADARLFFFSVMQLVMAWTAYREGHISLKELRVYFALAEIFATNRRSGARGEAAPKFNTRELRALVGGTGGERSAMRRLLAVGLLREVSDSGIEFATDPSELCFVPATLDDILALLYTDLRRVVPVPRHILRLIAGDARRTLIATILGHLIRCLKRGARHPKGYVKASWIAEVFGVTERSVHRDRQRLVALGWLIPQDASQHTLNRYGGFLAINLAWDGPTKAEVPFDHPAVPVTAVP